MVNIENYDSYSYLNEIKTYYVGDFNVFDSLAHGPTTIANGIPSCPTSYGLTIPFTLATFSIIDLFGYLKGSHGNPKDTESNFKSFFSGKLNNKEIAFLNYIFRQGLVHSFFPKAFLRIEYKKDCCSNKLFYANSSNSEYDCLNVKYLITLVIEVLKEVVDNSIKDESIHRKLKKTLKCQFKDYQKNKLVLE